VRANRFFISTHDTSKELLRERFDAVLEGELPVTTQFD